MTENEARKTLEIFDRERKEYMTSMPSTPYFDRVKADDFTQSLNIAIKSLEEIQQYRAIGTVKQLLDMKQNYAEALSDWRQYRKIGTVEECREAMERQTAKKPIKVDSGVYDYDFDYECPNCKENIGEDEHHCKCGQAISWESDTD